MTESAEERILWTGANMSLLQDIAAEFSETKPFSGLRIGVSLHIEPKTAVLFETLRRGGADVVAAGNYATTQDDVVAYLIDHGVDARGSGADDRQTHLSVVESVVEADPDILLDNGADLVAMAIATGRNVLGGTEETTSGHMRLDTELRDAVGFPVIVINDSPLKAIAENKHAVGQSTYESFCRITNLMPQGKQVLVVGYGWCGRGIAQYMRANGAQVSVAEVDELKTLEAALDGYRVGSVLDLISTADVVITATGAVNVIGQQEFLAAKNGSVLANAGHFPTEIDVGALEVETVEKIPLG
ncbi:MAG: adenosylhomocysteinase, partial [Acidimicrobiia bacterium]